MSVSQSTRRRLFATSLLAGATLLTGPAFAQGGAPGAGRTAQGASSTTPGGVVQSPQAAGQVSSSGISSTGSPDPNAPNAPADAAQAAPQQEVVVTGSLLRRKLDATDAPITTVTAENLSDRGITTIAQGVTLIAANSAGSLPNSFTANGAFAAGASTVSLRGLTSNSTLTVIDGLRTAYYPLADDGTRNFVDLNTIPDVIVDRIETLKDGASSIYGADAIAGVVNVITKHTYEGVTVKAEGGDSQHGGAGENNYQILVGKGNLARDGYNVYLGLEYEHDDALYNRERGYPYNTADLSQSFGTSLADGSRTFRANGIVNGIQGDNSFLGVGSTIVPVVRPYNGTTAQGDFQLLNPAAGCGGLRVATISPSQAAAGGAVGVTNPVTLCQQDLTHDYGEISPDDKRFSASLRVTKKLGENAEAYFAGTYYQNDVISLAAPSSVRQQSTPGALGLTFSTAGTPGLVLPVFVCAAGVNCTAANGTLNPNNPFAAQGQTASLRYLFGDIPASNEQFSQTYRIAFGVHGTFDLFGEWHYSVDATAAQTDLRNTSNGDIYIANLLNVVATGSYNFLNPAANTSAIRNFISPQLNQYSTSKLGQVQVNLSRTLYDLPGGPLQLAIIGAVRYESIFNPSSNSDANGATNRYFTVNPFGTIGSRNTRAGGFELDAPLLKQISVNVSGRYDEYSTGQDNFSPKVGGTIRPFADWFPALDKITLRSTYSQGFRIPSFAEANSLPTTGFTTANAPASFVAQHGGDKYGINYNLGQTTSGTAGLKPERSDNFTAGIVLTPVRQLQFSFDFYRIKKRDLITPNVSNLAAAVAAYYAGSPIPAGYTTIPGIPDPNFPNLQPTLGFISYGFTNLGQETTSGYDIGATANFNLPYDVKFTSAFDGNYVLRLNLDPMNGTPVQHYAGTIGPFAAVAAGGTPKFRANWQNTITHGPVSFTATAYFVDGYDLEAEDQGDTTGVCIVDGASVSQINAVYQDGVTPIQCKVKPFWDVDLHASYDVTKNIQLYVDVQNLIDRQAPYDPTTYGGDNYNSTFAGQGIIGRYFRFGARATF